MKYKWCQNDHVGPTNIFNVRHTTQLLQATAKAPTNINCSLEGRKNVITIRVFSFLLIRRSVVCSVAVQLFISVSYGVYFWNIITTKERKVTDWLFTGTWSCQASHFCNFSIGISYFCLLCSFEIASKGLCFRLGEHTQLLLPHVIILLTYTFWAWVTDRYYICYIPCIFDLNQQ